MWSQGHVAGSVAKTGCCCADAVTGGGSNGRSETRNLFQIRDGASSVGSHAVALCDGGLEREAEWCRVALAEVEVDLLIVADSVDELKLPKCVSGRREEESIDI